jgi:UDP-GlcNAc:undecaprenyl-phosphate GlcNAc-1-phosphate transferase
VGRYGEYALVFAVAAVATYLFAFPVRRLAVRFGAVDRPDELRPHAAPVPTIGGAAMFLGFTVAMALASQLGAFGPVFKGSSEPIGVGLAALVIYLVGLVDDIRNISPPAKVAGQVLASMVLVFLGVTMYYFKIPFVSTIFVLSPSILPLVTAIWVVVMANAVNLIDGLDGLAAGIIAIASGTLCIYGLRLEVLGNLTADNLGPLVAAITCGVCIGFLPHNFHPARVFMGDGGALFLGLLMAAATMVIGGRTTANGTAATDVTGLTFFRFAPLFIPVFILGVPILDMAFAIVRRTVHGTSFAERDLGHLHHRLVRLGHGHRRAVLILWAWTAVMSVFVLLLSFGLRFNAFVPFVGVFLVAVLYTAFLPGSRTPEPSPVAGGAGEETAEVPSEVSGAPPISVVMSAAAGVAVAGEPDLASPKTRRRRRVVRRARRGRAPQASSHDDPGIGTPPAHFAGSGDEMRG